MEKQGKVGATLETCVRKFEEVSGIFLKDTPPELLFRSADREQHLLYCRS